MKLEMEEFREKMAELQTEYVILVLERMRTERIKNQIARMIQEKQLPA